MAIVIVCQSCRQRFKVSEKFAGRKGPCPKCKAVIYIPKAEEQVQIHSPEHSEEGARGRSGELVLQPISRQAVVMPMWAVGAIAGAAVVVMVLALVMRGAAESTKHLMAAVGAIVLAPPLVLAGYTFLRDEELEPYTGLWLWVRTAICSAIYVLGWAVYARFIPPDWTDEVWKWAFLGPAFGVAGATVAFACFDFDYASGFFHFAFYVGVTLLLGVMMGLSIFGGSGG